MPNVRILNEQYDVAVRPADRLKDVWESTGDIIERDRGRAVGRVYGCGPTRRAAEEAVAEEAGRWLLRGLGMGRRGTA
jgi:hypothetical protein